MMIFKVEYVRNAEGKLDPKLGADVTSYPVPEELTQPGYALPDSPPQVDRISRETVGRLLAVLIAEAE